VGYFHEGFAKVKKDNKHGFINTQGEEMFGGIIFDDVESFGSGAAPVKLSKDGK